jgi:hypothetical protein
MPLLDHFHPPLLGQRRWESFHSFWATAIAMNLNTRLPKYYFAEVQVTIGPRIEVDVATLESQEEPVAQDTALGNGGVAVAAEVWAPPVATLQLPAVFPDEIEVRVFNGEGGPKLVAAVELVSPGNKDRDDARRAFAAKCLSYFQAGVGVVVVDIVTSRLANLHDELIDLMKLPETLGYPHEGSLYAVAYRPLRQNGTDRIDVWPAPMAVGQTLPTLPLAVRGLGCLRLELEASYSEARKVSRLG